MRNPFLFEAENPEYESRFEDSSEFYEDEHADAEYEDEFSRRRGGGRFPARPAKSRSLPLSSSGRGGRFFKRSAKFRLAPPPSKRPPRRPYPFPFSLPRFDFASGAAAQSASDASEMIRLVQSLLNRVLGLNLPVDGFMNVETRSAIRSFQNRKDAPAAGAAGSPDEGEPAADGTNQPAQPDDDADRTQEEYDAFEFYDNETDYFEFEEEVNRQSDQYAMWIQRSLNKIMRLRLAVDGIIGTQTRSAIRSFQQQQGLTADGIVGAITEGALIRAGASSPPQDSGTSPTPYNPSPVIPNGGSTPSGSPVSGGRVTSPFGYRIHPISGERKLHQGIDIGGLPVGTRINATGRGQVVFAADSGCSGKMVKVDHGNGYLTYYLHLNSIGVSPGQTVSRGQKVGELGQTGCVTGPHLHYEVRRDGVAVDPAPFING